MKDIERIGQLHDASVRKAYQRGIQEGWMDAMWLILIISGAVAFLAY
jgi:hypothetical protein